MEARGCPRSIRWTTGTRKRPAAAWPTHHAPRARQLVYVAVGIWLGAFADVSGTLFSAGELRKRKLPRSSRQRRRSIVSHFSLIASDRRCNPCLLGGARSRSWRRRAASGAENKRAPRRWQIFVRCAAINRSGLQFVQTLGANFAPGNREHPAIDQEVIL